MSLHIGHFLSSYPEVSGPSEVVRGLSRGLIRAGARVSLYGCGQPTELEADCVSELSRARVVRAEAGSRNPFRVPRAILDDLEQNHGGLDVLVLHSMFSPPLLAVARAARKGGIPYLICPHNPYHPELLRKNRLQKMVYGALFEKPLLRSARAVYLLSESHIPYLRALGVGTPVLVLPNGFDPASVISPAAATTERVSRGAASHRLLYLGRLEAHQKGLDLLVEALAAGIQAGSLPKDVTLRLVGPDWGSQRSLAALATRRGVSEHIQFAGPVIPDQRWSHLTWADMMVLPSRFEGFPMAVVEAMVAGLPVLLSTETGMSAMVSEAGCGWLIRPEVEPIAVGISRAFEQRDAWADMGARGQRFAYQHLTWDQIAAQTLTSFRSLLDKAEAESPTEADCVEAARLGSSTTGTRVEARQ